MLEELGDTCEATSPDCSVSSCHFIWSIHPRKRLRPKRPWERTQKTVIALGQASGGRGPHPAPPEGFGLGTLELLGGVCSQPFQLAAVNKKRKTKIKKTVLKKRVRARPRHCGPGCAACVPAASAEPAVPSRQRPGSI